MALQTNPNVQYNNTNTSAPNATKSALAYMNESDFRKKGYQPVTMKDNQGTFRTGYVYTNPNTGKGTTYDPYTGNEVGAGTVVYTKSGVPYIKNADGTSSVSNDTDFVDPSYLYDRGTPVNASDANGVTFQGARTLNNITYDSNGYRIPDGSLNYADNGIDYQKTTGYMYGLPYNHRYETVLDPSIVTQQSIPDYMREAGMSTAQDLMNNYQDAADRMYQQELDSLNYANLSNQRTLENMYREQALNDANNMANLKLNGGNAASQFALAALAQQANQKQLADQLTSTEEARKELLDQYATDVANARVNAMNQFDANALEAGDNRAADTYNQTQAYLAYQQYLGALAQAEAQKDIANAYRYQADRSANQITEQENEAITAWKGYLKTKLPADIYKTLEENGDLNLYAAVLRTDAYGDNDTREQLIADIIKLYTPDNTPDGTANATSTGLAQKIINAFSANPNATGATISTTSSSTLPIIKPAAGLAAGTAIGVDLGEKIFGSQPWSEYLKNAATGIASGDLESVSKSTNDFLKSNSSTLKDAATGAATDAATGAVSSSNLLNDIENILAANTVNKVSDKISTPTRSYLPQTIYDIKADLDQLTFDDYGNIINGDGFVIAKFSSVNNKGKQDIYTLDGRHLGTITKKNTPYYLRTIQDVVNDMHMKY